MESERDGDSLDGVSPGGISDSVVSGDVIHHHHYQQQIQQPQQIIFGQLPPLIGTPAITGRPAQMMGFGDAIKNAIVNNYVNFSGRASRSEYWWFTLFNFIVGIVVLPIDMALGYNPFAYDVMDPYASPSYGFGTSPVNTIATLALLLPGLGLFCRRLHDGNRSGWWLLIGIIPLVNCFGIFVLLYFLIAEGQPHANNYGAVPTNTLEESAPF